MPKLMFLPLFENENEKCFCLNENVMRHLRQDGGEEIILYFNQSFWDRYPKPFGIERMREIIESIMVPVSYIAIIAEWKYLDKYVRSIDGGISIPSTFEEYLNELKCISVPITSEVDDTVHDNGGWGMLTCPELYVKSQNMNKSYNIDPKLEDKLISLEMMNANEKLVQFYDHNLGNINISMN